MSVMAHESHRRRKLKRAALRFPYAGRAPWPGNMKHRAPTEAGTPGASRIDEWMHLLGEFARHGGGDIAMRANIMLMNCGLEGRNATLSSQMRVRAIRGQERRLSP